MELELTRKIRSKCIDLEDSPMGNGELCKVQAVEHSVSNFDLFRNFDIKREEKMEEGTENDQYLHVSNQLDEIISELTSILEELNGEKMCE